MNQIHHTQTSGIPLPAELQQLCDVSASVDAPKQTKSEKKKDKSKATANKEVEVNGEKGLALYIDGSARPNPGFGGWGLHGYMYEDVVPKKGSGNSTQYLTHLGYVGKSEAKDDKPKEVKPLKYFDGYGSFALPVSNNYAELAGAAYGVGLANEHDVSKVVLYSDSKFVIGNVDKIDHWISNQWFKSDGTAVSHPQLWQELYSHRKSLQDKGVKVEFRWIKGHSIHTGNNIADKNAGIGSSQAMKGQAKVEMNITDAEGYWSDGYERHPFLYHRSMYFSTYPESIVPGEYYLGEHGKDDELIAKATADCSYSAIMLSEPDQLAELLRRYQVERSEGREVLILGRLNKLYESSVAKDILRFGDACFMQPKPHRLDLNFVDDEPITRELTPPLLAIRAIQAVNQLKGILLEWKQGDRQRITCTSLTEQFYDISAKGDYTLKSQFTVGYSKYTTEVNYKNQNKQGAAKVDLVLSADMPDRNTLKRLEKFKPVIEVVTWMESDDAFRYATVIQCGQDFGIWAAYHSNLRMIV